MHNYKNNARRGWRALYDRVTAVIYNALLYLAILLMWVALLGYVALDWYVWHLKHPETDLWLYWISGK